MRTLIFEEEFLAGRFMPCHSDEVPDDYRQELSMAGFNMVRFSNILHGWHYDETDMSQVNLTRTKTREALR